MGFAETSKVPEGIDSGAIRGKQYQIACNTWFTSTGTPIPLSFKFEGDDGEIIKVKQLEVKYTEDKNYSGIPSKEYGCRAIIGGLTREFRLIFYCEACKWVMLV